MDTTRPTQQPYGPLADQHTAWFPPRAEPTGTRVVFVHGGFWRERWDRTHALPLAEALAERGHLVSLPEYRRVGSPGWTGYRDTLDDVAAAVSLDAPAPVARTVLVGHSAGGHLALWAGFRAALRPDAVVSLAGCVDLRLADAWHLGDDATAELMGGHAADRAKQFADADPAQQGEAPFPVTLIHGDRDEDVPVDLSRAYAAAHPAVRLVELPGVGHMALVEPSGPAFEALLTALAPQPPEPAA